MHTGKPMASSSSCILTGSSGHMTGNREGAPVCVWSHSILVLYFCIIIPHQYTL